MCQAPTTEGTPDFPAGGRLSFMLLPLLALHVAPGAWKAGLFSREAAGRNAQDVFFFVVVTLFLAALGLPCFVRALSPCGERGHLPSFCAAASVVAEHSSRVCGLQ